MNTGSNPVGVAGQKPSETNTKSDDNGTDVQALAQRWPKVGETVEVSIDPGEPWERGVVVAVSNRIGGERDGLTVSVMHAGKEVLCHLRLPAQEKCWRWPEDSQQPGGITPSAPDNPTGKTGDPSPSGSAEKQKRTRKRKATSPEAPADEPSLKEVELYGGAVRGWERKRVVSVGVKGFTTSEDAFYSWESEGKAWRKVGIATAQDDEVGCDVDPLKQTAGKNGMPELPAVGAVPGPRTCKGIPIYQGPDEVCDALLGREVQGDRCTVCAEWMRAHGECDGCNGRLPGWQVTGKLCADCRAVRQATIRERVHARECSTCGASERCASFAAGVGKPACPLWVPRFEAIPESAEQPNDKPGRSWEGFLVDAYRAFAESLWERMAEDAALDPVTVAACKQLRDDERVFSSIFLARGLR